VPELVEQMGDDVTQARTALAAGAGGGQK
jgi:hypothetical protein